MKVAIIESVLGVFAVDDHGVVDKVPFPKVPATIAGKLINIRRGNIVSEMEILVSKLKERYKQFVFEDGKLAKLVEEKLQVQTVVEKPSSLGKAFRRKFDEVATGEKLVKNKEELRNLLLNVSLIMACNGIKAEGERKDLLIVQLINAVDELTKSLNLLSMKVRELYGLHFPELNKVVDRHETYLKLTSNLGYRDAFSLETLTGMGMDEKTALKIANAASSSIGGDLPEESIKNIQDFSSSILSLFSLKRRMEEYLGKLMEEVAPNVKSIAGPMVGARLIALAGGLRNLSKMPASKIQVLGAEKALFRALRTGTKPPKHGVIFQHPDVHSTKRKLRGRVSRLLSNKITIAARMDAFTGKVDPSLKEDYLEKLKRILQR